MALKSMSIDRLTSLREKVDATLRTKITETRRDLEAKLAETTQKRVVQDAIAALSESIAGG